MKSTQVKKPDTETRKWKVGGGGERLTNLRKTHFPYCWMNGDIWTLIWILVCNMLQYFTAYCVDALYLPSQFKCVCTQLLVLAQMVNMSQILSFGPKGFTSWHIMSHTRFFEPYPGKYTVAFVFRSQITTCCSISVCLILPSFKVVPYDMELRGVQNHQLIM